MKKDRYDFNPDEVSDQYHEIMGRLDLYNEAVRSLTGNASFVIFPLRFHHEEACDIAADALLETAIKYDEARGTSIRTFFVRNAFWRAGKLIDERVRAPIVNVADKDHLAQARCRNPRLNGDLIIIADQCDHALGCLTLQQRCIIELKFYRRYKVPEIAEAFGLTPKGIYWHIEEGLRKMKKALGCPEG